MNRVLGFYEERALTAIMENRNKATTVEIKNSTLEFTFTKYSIRETLHNLKQKRFVEEYTSDGPYRVSFLGFEALKKVKRVDFELSQEEYDEVFNELYTGEVDLSSVDKNLCQEIAEEYGD